MDNQNPDTIVVFLGDLSGDLPSSEREYWKAFNIPPQGGLSKTAFTRNILGEFADPEKVDYKFKLELKRLNTKWNSTYQWPLFRPLREEDEHIIKHLRIPLNSVQSEFDQQILYLTIILIDSLNEKMIAKNTTSTPANSKGITKLECFLNEGSYPYTDDIIIFLRALQDIRSAGVAHRKGSSFQKALDSLNIDPSDYVYSFENILSDATKLITNLKAFIDQGNGAS